MKLAKIWQFVLNFFLILTTFSEIPALKLVIGQIKYMLNLQKFQETIEKLHKSHHQNYALLLD